MRTAMIAALSCALLCGPWAVQPAQAYKCGLGEMRTTLTHVGRINATLPHGSTQQVPAEHYVVDVSGMILDEWRDVPNIQYVYHMGMFLKVGSARPVELKFVRKIKSAGQDGLQFDPWETVDGRSSALIRAYESTTVHPLEVYYTSANDIKFKINVEVNAEVIKDADKLKASDIRVYVEGKDKRSEQTFRLFDTITACKE